MNVAQAVEALWLCLFVRWIKEVRTLLKFPFLTRLFRTLFSFLQRMSVSLAAFIAIRISYGGTSRLSRHRKRILCLKQHYLTAYL